MTIEKYQTEFKDNIKVANGHINLCCYYHQTTLNKDVRNVAGPTQNVTETAFLGS
jgi:hypothetical protein